MKNLKLTFLAIFTFLILTKPVFAVEEKYKLDPFHTSVTWSASHFGFSKPSGKFTDIDGEIVLDEKNPKKSFVNITIKTSSINTGLEKFDQHLKSVDFFNVEKFPTATFVSKNVVVTGKNTAKVEGDFTLLGITKPITIDVKLNKLGTHPFTQKKTVGFSAKAKIKRSEFGMNYAVPGVSDNVDLMIELEANL